MMTATELNKHFPQSTLQQAAQARSEGSRAAYDGLVVERLPQGGFVVTERRQSHEFWQALAAFSMLSEALDFVREKLEQR